MHKQNKKRLKVDLTQYKGLTLNTLFKRLNVIQKRGVIVEKITPKSVTLKL